MSRSVALVLVAALAGCSPAKGRWLGECGYGGDGSAVRLDVLTDDGGALTVSFALSDMDGTTTLSGSGTRDGTELSLDLTDDAGTASTFDAAIDGRAMIAVWSRTLGTETVDADCTLSRD